MAPAKPATIPTDPEALLTYRQVAALTGICQRSVWTAVNCGELPAVRIGRAVRIRRRGLLEWIDRLERKGVRL